MCLSGIWKRYCSNGEVLYDCCNVYILLAKAAALNVCFPCTENENCFSVRKPHMGASKKYLWDNLKYVWHNSKYVRHIFRPLKTRLKNTRKTQTKNTRAFFRLRKRMNTEAWYVKFRRTLIVPGGILFLMLPLLLQNVATAVLFYGDFKFCGLEHGRREAHVCLAALEGCFQVGC